MINVNELSILAREAGICEEWGDRLLSVMSVDQLLEMYVRGIDFCLSENFPTKEYLVKHAEGKLGEYGIYVNANMSSVNGRFLVLLGDSAGAIRIDGHEVSQVFVKHNSKAKLSVEGNAFVVVDCFDDSIVEIGAVGDSKVLVNVYRNAKVEFESNDKAYVKVVKKGKDTY